jgi:hypothetical protein
MLTPEQLGKILTELDYVEVDGTLHADYQRQLDDDQLTPDNYDEICLTLYRGEVEHHDPDYDFTLRELLNGIPSKDGLRVATKHNIYQLTFYKRVPLDLVEILK